MDAVVNPYYQDGAVTIYHADCRDVLASLPAGSVDLTFTDPPYGVKYRSNRRVERFDHIEGDDGVEWLAPVWHAVHAVQRPDTFLISFYGWPWADLFWQHWRAAEFRSVSHFIFTKNVWGLGYYSRTQHENAVLLAKGTPPQPDPVPSDWWPDWDRVHGHEHPTEKPVGALKGPMLAYCPAGGLVLDPFMGSGSTLRAAKDLGLHAIGIEVEEEYCEVAARRMRQEVLFG